jgi:hypothetical protein
MVMGDRQNERRMRFFILAWSSCLVCLCGCASVPWPFTNWTHAGSEQSVAKSSAAAPKSSATAANADSLKEVMAELQEAGAIDPAAREELIADLKQTDPSRWPLVMQEFRAAAAYRRRVEARAKEKQESDSPEVASFHSTPPGYKKNGAELIANYPHPGPLPEGDGDSRPHHADRDDYMTPLPNVPAVMIADNHLALAPEPRLPGGADTRFSVGHSASDKQGEAIAIPIEPPPLAIRLASSRVEKALPAGEASATTTSNALTPGPSPGTARSVVGRGENVAGPSPKGRGENAVPLTQADWQSHLAAAIRSMESASTPGSSSENDVAMQARLRMLYLLAGRRDDAMRPLPSAPRATQDYWTSQIYGLSTWMDSERTPDPARRAAETKRILSEALKPLGDAAPLAVRNLTFCTAVQYYGSFDALKSAEFKPGQKVLLYAEVENFHTEPSPKGFHTAVKFNWQILDSRGNRAGDYVSATSEDHSLTPKHEFFLTKWFYLPDAMPSGRYTLQFTVEDVLGHKVGQSSIELTVR